MREWWWSGEGGVRPQVLHSRLKTPGPPSGPLTPLNPRERVRGFALHYLRIGNRSFICKETHYFCITLCVTCFIFQILYTTSSGSRDPSHFEMQTSTPVGRVDTEMLKSFCTTTSANIIYHKWPEADAPRKSTLVRGRSIRHSPFGIT